MIKEKLEDIELRTYIHPSGVKITVGHPLFYFQLSTVAADFPCLSDVLQIKHILLELVYCAYGLYVCITANG